ncbi:MAG: PilN domain-containing protein [Acidobacteriota bacterium]|nr:PilN domain-containing protein [Acidobacteriota bacterium]
MSTAAPEMPAIIESPVSTVQNAGDLLPLWRRALVFGTGLGIAIGDRNLEIAVVSSRPSGPARLSSVSIADFRNRPAAQWGQEAATFLTQAGGMGLAATVLLPRSEVIVRTLTLPGVGDKDIPAAIELQIDTLHPWGDVDVAWGWSRAAAGTGDVLIGLARRDLLESYETVFTEAGIGLAAATFSPAVIHAALRIWSAPPGSVLCYEDEAPGRTEIYGESPARPVFSAEFPLPRERALALARGELRLPAGSPAMPMAQVLPRVAGSVAVPENAVLSYAAALAGSAPRAARFANLLPAGRRASHNRMQYLVPGILGSLVALALLTVFLIFPAVEQRRYRAELDSAGRQLEPAALRAQTLEKKIAAARARIALSDEIKRRPQADLDVLNELTKLLPPPIWTSSVEIYPDSVVISGEADQASSLLKTLDSSPLFQNSEFMVGVARNAQAEQFRIRTMRRGRVGRTTP